MGDELTTEDLTGRAATQTRDDAEQTDRAPEGSDSEPAEPAGTRADSPTDEPLLEAGDAQEFETRWHEIQVAFVDEPRAAVERADNLVAELMRHLAETFADERRGLEEAWSAGEDVDTENLRVALTRYRSFFQRLLAT